MNITWNAQNYKDNFCFVPQYGEDVMELLTAPEGSHVIDLGCGNGTLTEKLSGRGYTVTGIDVSKDMLDLARKEHPDLTFIQADALSFTLEEKADAIFSNAVFHWIDEKNQEIMIANIGKMLCRKRAPVSENLLFPNHRGICPSP